MPTVGQKPSNDALIARYVILEYIKDKIGGEFVERVSFTNWGDFRVEYRLMSGSIIFMLLPEEIEIVRHYWELPVPTGFLPRALEYANPNLFDEIDKVINENPPILLNQ